LDIAGIIEAFIYRINYLLNFIKPSVAVLNAHMQWHDFY